MLTFSGNSAEGNESGEREREREHGEREGVGACECLGAMGWALPQLASS